MTTWGMLRNQSVMHGFPLASEIYHDTKVTCSCIEREDVFLEFSVIVSEIWRLRAVEFPQNSMLRVATRVFVDKCVFDICLHMKIVLAIYSYLYCVMGSW